MMMSCLFLFRKTCTVNIKRNDSVLTDANEQMHCLSGERQQKIIVHFRRNGAVTESAASHYEEQ